MRKSLKVSRGMQLFGVVLMVGGIIGRIGSDYSPFATLAIVAGFVAVIAARAFEWMVKE